MGEERKVVGKGRGGGRERETRGIGGRWRRGLRRSCRRRQGEGHVGRGRTELREVKEERRGEEGG